MAKLTASDEAAHQGSGERLWCPGVVLSVLAVLLRILVATRRDGIEIDGITYLRNAAAMAGDWQAVNVLHPPLYSLVLMPVLGLWRDPEWGARVVSAVLGGLWVWPTLWLARQTAPERLAWMAGLLVAVMPAGVEASTRVSPEALFGLCLGVLLVMLLATLHTGRLGWACLAGLLGGLATLARPEGMGYLALAVALLGAAPVLAGPHWSWKRAACGAAVIVTVWLAVLLPYMTLVRHQTGRWHWSGKMGITLLWAESVGQERSHAIVEQVITETQQSQVPQSLIRYIAAHPTAMVRRVAVNLHLMDKYTIPDLLHCGGLVLIVLGFAHLSPRRWPALPEWFLVAALLPLAGLLLFVVEWRYFVTAIPVLSVVAALGVARAGRSGSPRERHRSNLVWLVWCVALLSFVPWLVRPWMREDPAGVEKKAGLWLRETAGPGAVFIGRYPVLGYYADAAGIPFARRPLREAIAEGRRAGARFLVVDSLRLPESRPDLLPLVGGERILPDLDLAKAFEDRGGNRVVIYTIAPGGAAR